jgi:hypothetical protein
LFNIEEFYLKARNGIRINVKEFADYLRSFDAVILWGAGNLGANLGKKLIQLKIPIKCYWDRRANELRSIHQISVHQPFSGTMDKDRTIIIPCISNGSSGGEWCKQILNSNGYQHFVNGMDIYEGLFCPINHQTGINPKICLESSMCNICACDRFINIIAGHQNETDALLTFNVITFIINQKCTLRCRYCGQYMNQYPKENRINFPLEQIKDDIDRFFDAVDAVGMVSIIGGEPFLHPELDSIVNHILTKKNFGVVNITTNGICKLTESQLIGFDNPRIKISFSHYKGGLSETQEKIFQKNVELVKNANIIHSVGIPVWSKPAPLSNKRYTPEKMINMKKHCNAIKLCMSVKNGIFYPCSRTEPLHCLRVADYPSDYVNLTQTSSPQELRNKLIAIMNAPYYKTCNHCSTEGSELLTIAGEQEHD